MDDLANMMKDLKIFELEKQLFELAKVGQQAEKGQIPMSLLFYPPNQYGNRYYPGGHNQHNQHGQQQQQYMGQYQCYGYPLTDIGWYLSKNRPCTLLLLQLYLCR